MKIERRRALRIGAGMLAAGAALTGTSLPRAAASDGTEWGYFGARGPENWGSLDPSYGTCASGRDQSPVDLRDSREADLDALQIFWRPLPLDVLNNGHTIQVNAAEGSFVVVDGKRFDLLQFHFHHPSEHHIVGQPAPMEVHFVHKSAEGGLAVIGVMMVEGEPNETIAQIWANVPVVGQRNRPSTPLDATALLPARHDHFRYAGSLTTPPCSEIVDWVVMTQPVSLSGAQIQAFGQLYPMNARPIQPLHRRFILGTF